MYYRKVSIEHHCKSMFDVLPPPGALRPLLRPTASISSIKRMQGEFFLAMANISRTLAGPTPTNISRNSEPDTEMKGTLASPAVALPSRVFPVPGGPFKMAPKKNEYSKMSSYVEDNN